jgi:hypothetical protein
MSSSAAAWPRPPAAGASQAPPNKKVEAKTPPLVRLLLRRRPTPLYQVSAEPTPWPLRNAGISRARQRVGWLALLDGRTD